MFDIKYYQAGSGKEPFTEWLDCLKDRKGRAIIRSRLDRLRLGDFGNHRFVGDGVTEIKVDFGPGYRIYFGKIGSTVVLLLCAGDKSSQGRDILKAKEYLKNYRSENNEKK